MTTRAIGHRLGISPHTASRHVEAIYAKLGNRDRASTVLATHRLGLLGA
ncbi:LuxR C-terminal-related transcriptional regulator [Actinoallomurus sp. NPDC050550]